MNINFLSSFPKQLNKYLFGFLPPKNFFEAKLICKKACALIKEITNESFTKLENAFQENCQTLTQRGWSREKIIYILIKNQTGHIYRTINEICSDSVTIKKLHLWEQMVLIFKETSNEEHNIVKKSKAIQWPENDRNLAAFLFQNMKDLQQGEQICYVQEKKIPNTNKTYKISFNVPKECLETTTISLIYRQNHFIIEPIALDELCFFKNLTNLELDGHSYSHFPHALNKLTQLTFLSLNGCDIEEIEEGVFFPALTTLKLKDNKLSKLPLSLQKSPFLKCLNISENKFNRSSLNESLHDEEGKFGFKMLRFLYINDNDLSEEDNILLTKEFKEQQQENGIALWVKNKK